MSKPDPKMYQKVLELLNLEAKECIMVAAHAYDLRAAAKMSRVTFYNLLLLISFFVEESRLPMFIALLKTQKRTCSKFGVSVIYLFLEQMGVPLAD